MQMSLVKYCAWKWWKFKKISNIYYKELKIEELGENVYDIGLISCICSVDKFDANQYNLTGYRGRSKAFFCDIGLRHQFKHQPFKWVSLCHTLYRIEIFRHSKNSIWNAADLIWLQNVLLVSIFFISPQDIFTDKPSSELPSW